jgi:hypothetical protein
MSNKARYFKIALLVLTVLSIISFLNGDPGGPARYQYGHNFFIRASADMISLFAVAFVILRIWKRKVIDKLFIFVFVAYLLMIIPDLNVWLWWWQVSWLYLLLLAIHSFPILICLNQFLSKKDIRIKNYLASGLLLFILGFIYDVIFLGVPNQDSTQEMFEKAIQMEVFRNWFYYIGVVVILLGLVKSLKWRSGTH